MNFAELVAEVILITKRPDLVTKIESAVRAATLKAHHINFFYKDIYEVPINMNIEAFLHSFDPLPLVPRYRKQKYLRPFDGVSPNTVGPFIEFIQIESAIDTYGYHKENVFYNAGALIQVRVNPAQQYFIFGCYMHPVVTPEESYESWIAREYPFAIIYEASRAIFKGIGYDEQSAQMRELVSEQAAILTISVGTEETPT